MPAIADIEVRPLDMPTARDLMIENHYSHTWQATFGIRNFGVYHGDRLLGAAVYGHPMNPASWAKVTTTPPEECLELNRLWIDDELGANTETWTLGRTFRLLREEGYSLIQSFADGRLGVGTIYQAANFTYHGYHETTFQRSRSTGETLHGARFSNTSSRGGLLDTNYRHVLDDLDAFRVRTYRYIYPLTKRARRSILLTAKPYPKERAGEIPVPDYTPPASQIARCVAMCEAIDDPRRDDFAHYLATLTPEPDRLIAEQRDNRWIRRFASGGTAAEEREAARLARAA